MRMRFIFQGRVQGVGFRATARHIAAGFAITGWVRNDPGGTVTLEAQGEPDEVERFLAELRRVMGRNISSEQSTPTLAAEGEQGFDIRR